MARFLANETVPRDARDAARKASIDIASIREDAPGEDDEEVLHEQRVVVVPDKDFGALAFRCGRNATRGVIVLRPQTRSPDHAAMFLVNVWQQPIDRERRFPVASEGQIQFVPLPESP